MILILGVLLVLIGMGVVLVGSQQSQQRQNNQRLVEYLTHGDDVDYDGSDAYEAQLHVDFVSRVIRPMFGNLNRAIGRRLPGNARQRADELLNRAGLSGRFRPEEVVAGQVVAGTIGLVVGVLTLLGRVFTPATNVGILVLLPVIGALIPGVLLRRSADERQARILADLPDILDLLAISVEAGVGFEGAVQVVCERFDTPLGRELDRMLKEMELGVSRRDALQNLRARTDVPEFGAVIVALVQADTLGMSVGQVLKLQAAEMRMRRRQWAREKAGKLPVKILFPLMFCIFPAVLVIVLGPAGAQITKAFR